MMEFRSPLEIVAESLPLAIREIYETCTAPEPKPVNDLRAIAGAYMADLRSRSQEAEFLDLDTAERAFNGCMELLASLEATPSAEHHVAIQATALYFVLEDDAEHDDSIVGFDDDWLVVETTSRILKRPITGL
mgnify:CR=1 FL=1